MRIPVASAIAFPAAVKNAEMFVCNKRAPPSKVRLIKYVFYLIREKYEFNKFVVIQKIRKTFLFEHK